MPITRRYILASALAAPILIGARPGAAALPQTLSGAERLDQLRAIAVWRDGSEIAAQGYHGWTPDQPTNIKSASKSIISALAGIAIARGHLQGPDQPIAPILRADLPADPDPRVGRWQIDSQGSATSAPA